MFKRPFSPNVTFKKSNRENIYVLGAIILNQCCILISIGYMWIGPFQRKLSFTSSILIICMITSCTAYSFEFDTGTSMSFALSATVHVLSEVYLTIVAIIIVLRMLTFSKLDIISKIEKHRIIQNWSVWMFVGPLKGTLGAWYKVFTLIRSVPIRSYF